MREQRDKNGSVGSAAPEGGVLKAHVQDMSVASEQGMWWPAVAKTVWCWNCSKDIPEELFRYLCTPLGLLKAAMWSASVGHA